MSTTNIDIKNFPNKYKECTDKTKTIVSRRSAKILSSNIRIKTKPVEEDEEPDILQTEIASVPRVSTGLYTFTQIFQHIRRNYNE